MTHINNLQERSGASRFSNPTIHEGLDSPVRRSVTCIYLVFLSNSLAHCLTFRTSQIREDPHSYSPPRMQRYESFENPLAGRGSQSFGSQEERVSSANPQHGSALYDFTAGGDDEVTCSLISLCGFVLLFHFFR